MESTAKIVLKCVCLLTMFVLSLAAVSAPQGSIVKPDYLTKFEICVGTCGLGCAFLVEEPPMYAACVAACSIATCPPPPTTLENVGYGCTHGCVSSMSKVMTSATTKPSINGTQLNFYSSTLSFSFLI